MKFRKKMKDSTSEESEIMQANKHYTPGIVRNYLSIEEFNKQGTSASQVFSIAKFHENAAKQIEIDKKFIFWKEAAEEHREIAEDIRQIANRMR